MRVYIWVHKRDVINNEITNYYLWRPQMTCHENHVQVSITPDEFTRLEEKEEEEWEEISPLDSPLPIIDIGERHYKKRNV